MSAAIGIDLGTSYSCVGIFHDKTVKIIANDQGNRTTPSYVAFTDSERLIGERAKRHNSPIFDAKRLIGRKFDDPGVQSDMNHWPFKIQSEGDRPLVEVQWEGETKKLSAEEISSMVLVKMKETAEAFLGRTVKDAVVSVPAYYNDSQRKAVQDAGTISGLNVLAIINEPTAAAMAFAWHLRDIWKETRNIVICDVGASNAQVSVVAIGANSFKILASRCDPHLGGEDFDNRMVDHCVERFKDKHGIQLTVGEHPRAFRSLHDACEKAKRTLSIQETVRVEIDSLLEGIGFNLEITRAEFDDMVDDLFTKIPALIDTAIGDANLDLDAVAKIVLVGGSTRIPKVRDLILAQFDNSELNLSLNRDEAIAHGAAQLAHILSHELERPKEICSHKLSTEMAGNDDTNLSLVERGTQLPTGAKSREFRTEQDGDKTVSVQVFEGEGDFSDEKALMREYLLTVVSEVQNRTRAHEVKVDFLVDEDGLLTLEPPGALAEIDVSITNNGDRLSQDEIDRMVNEEKKYKADDLTNEKNKLESFAKETKQRAADDRLWGQRISLHDRETVKSKCDQVVQWLKDNPAAKKYEIEPKRKALETACKSLNEAWEKLPVEAD